MSHWQKYGGDATYYILVDSKPAEVVDNTKPDTVFCTAFVSTASCINGVRRSDLHWFKQYKECETLEESMSVLEQLRLEILNDNFQELYVWIVSSKFSTININGAEFLRGACKEVPSLSVEGEFAVYGNQRYKLDKAKMLIWYNFCLCNMATFLVDRTVKWNQKRAIFHVDRLGDSDKRIQNFMRMVMEETSLRDLWKRCTEDHEKKPEWVGYEFPSHMDANRKIIPAQNSMQSSLVDWIVLAAYAHRNGTENRDPSFQKKLVEFIELLNRLNMINGMHITGDMKWQ
jgi:hypothetical protein